MNEEEMLTVWFVYNDGRYDTATIKDAPKFWLGRWGEPETRNKPIFIDAENHPHAAELLAIADLMGLDIYEESATTDFEVLKSWWIGPEVNRVYEWRWEPDYE